MTIGDEKKTLISLANDPGMMSEHMNLTLDRCPGTEI